MARIRTIKPETFDDPDLCALDPISRWLFVGLWTQADKAGRLEDDPRRLKIRILPFDDGVDMDALLDALAPKFITRYVVDGQKYIQVNNFIEHQRPHPKESDSLLPPMPAGTSREITRRAVENSGKPGKAGASRVDTGSGNGSGKESGCGKAAAGLRPQPARAKPLAYKPRIDVAWPGRPPVPSALHAEFVDKLGGDAEDAHQRLLAWYPEAAARYADQPIGDDDFAFWRHRFRDWVGTTRTADHARAAPAPRYPEADGCQHDPPCSSPEWHAMLVARASGVREAIA